MNSQFRNYDNPVLAEKIFNSYKLEIDELDLERDGMTAVAESRTARGLDMRLNKVISERRTFLKEYCPMANS